MINTEEILEIHNLLIDEFGGSKGVRDKTSLEAAIGRPYATFDQMELYPDPIDKAAAILESILINHPFIDGNKRTGYVLMRLILLQYKLDIDTSKTGKYNFVIAVAKGEMTKEAIKVWLRSNIKKKDEP